MSWLEEENWSTMTNFLDSFVPAMELTEWIYSTEIIMTRDWFNYDPESMNGDDGMIVNIGLNKPRVQPPDNNNMKINSL